MKRRGFTLLEVMIALGIFAIGATAAFGVLVAAASAERRASHQIHAALIADGVFSEIQADLAPGTTLQDLVDDGGRAEGTTIWRIEDQNHPVYSDYKYDVALTPIPCGDPNEAWTWYVEVEVRWAERGQGRNASFNTVLLSQGTHFDNPVPRAERGGGGVRIR